MFGGMRELKSTALKQRVRMHFAEVKQAGTMSCQLLMTLLVIALYICSTAEASHCSTNGKSSVHIRIAFLVPIHLFFLFLELFWHYGIL
jgi:hypothetical protein